MRNGDGPAHRPGPLKSSGKNANKRVGPDSASIFKAAPDLFVEDIKQIVDTAIAACHDSIAWRGKRCVKLCKRMGARVTGTAGEEKNPAPATTTSVLLASETQRGWQQSSGFM